MLKNGTLHVHICALLVIKKFERQARYSYPTFKDKLKKLR